MDRRILRFGAKMVSNRLRGKHSPFIVQLTLLNQCNYQCGYCYAEYYNRGGKSMSLERVYYVLECLAKAGAFRVNLLGGEPLIRKDVEQIVDRGNELGLMMVMNTNGYFVRERIELVKRLYSICISLDGDQKTNDLNRGEGTFAQTMDGVEACRENGIPVNFSAVLSRHTCDQVDYLVGVARQYGGMVDFTTLISQEREGNKNNESLYPRREQLDSALRRIIELRKQGAPIGFSIASYQHALNWPDHKIPYYEGREPAWNDVACLAGRDYIFIDYNGDIYPCPQRVGLMRHGNIFTDGFDEAYRIAAGHECKTCHQPCTTDLSLFFGARPGTIVSKARQGLTPLLRRRPA